MSLFLGLLIFNPLWVTLLTLIALILVAWLLSLAGLWARCRYWFFGAGFALYAIDAAIALPRVLFSYGLSNHPVVARKVPLPRQLVLVGIPCQAKCHELLISGAVEDVVVARPGRSGEEEKPQAIRYRAGWSNPGACPDERQRPIDYSSRDLLKTGYCPLIDPVDIPSQGIFLIRESMTVLASQRARSFTPTYLTKSPPGSVIEFAGTEVQDRSASGVTVLASTYRYTAPGFLGLPPLVGCWDRPDNVIWIMPPGDTGCGLWRWFTWGGDRDASADPKWLYDVFAPPDRSFVPPKKPELNPPTPAEALEILANAQVVDDYLPGLLSLVLDRSNTDAALTDLVIRLVRRGNLEGSLVALLAKNRPSSLAGLRGRLDPVPINFYNSGAVLQEMETDPAFRDQFADTLFRALAAHWPPKSENVDRFLNLMTTNHPEWLCERLDRLPGPDGILKARENRVMKNYDEAMPSFIPLIVQMTAHACPGQTAELIRELLSTARPARRAETANLILRILHGAGQSCEIPTRNVQAYMKQETEPVPFEMLVRNLENIRNSQARGPCRT